MISSFCFAPDADGSWFVAQAYAGGHFITYDGSMYEFNGVGEYLLTNTTLENGEEINVTILQVKINTI